MIHGFTNQTLDVRTGNGLDDELLEALGFVRASGEVLRAPIGSTTDGLSVPRCIQNIIPATGGDWFSGVIHDSAYRNQLEILCRVTGNWVKAKYNRKECDDLILEAMITQGVGLLERRVIYCALRIFGWKAFKDDRK